MKDPFEKITLIYQTLLAAGKHSLSIYLLLPTCHTPHGIKNLLGRVCRILAVFTDLLKSHPSIFHTCFMQKSGSRRSAGVSGAKVTSCKSGRFIAGPHRDCFAHAHNYGQFISFQVNLYHRMNGRKLGNLERTHTDTGNLQTPLKKVLGRASNLEWRGNAMPMCHCDACHREVSSTDNTLHWAQAHLSSPSVFGAVHNGIISSG